MKLWYSFTKELQLTSKSFYFWWEFITAAIIIAVLLLAVPKQWQPKTTEYLNFQMPKIAQTIYLDELLKEDVDGHVENTQLKLDSKTIPVQLYETNAQSLYIIENETDLEHLAKAHRPDVAVSIAYDTNKHLPIFTYYLQGYESKRLQNLFKILHTKDINIMHKKADAQTVTSLETGHKLLNSREMALPSLLTFNGSLMGMFIIVAYIFLDKQAGIIKAYAVTASSIEHYLISKILVMAFVATLTTFAITFTIMGKNAHYLLLLVLLLTSSFFASSLGLLIASFYDNMTQAFASIYLVMMLFMMPAIAYFIPSWSPLWIKFLPTHYIIQGFKESLLPQGNLPFIFITSGLFLLFGTGLFILTTHRFKKTLVA